MDRRNQFETKIAISLAGILMFAVLSFGSVEIWASAIVEASVFTLFVSWLIMKSGPAESLQEDEPGRNREERYMLLALSGILMYALIQTLPLAPAVLKYISPRSFEIYSFYAVDEKPAMYISLYPHRTHIEFLLFLACSLFFVLAFFAMRDMHRLEMVIKIISFFGFCLAVFALLQKATWDGKIYWFREITVGSPFGPFVNRNHYAGLMGMIIPLTLGYAFTRSRREKQLLFGFFALIMAVSLFLSLSRGGIISFLAATVLFAFYLLWDKFKTNKKWALAAFIGILCLYLLYVGINPVIDRFYQTDISHEARFNVWTETFRAFQDFYLTGSGFGTFINVIPLYASRPTLLIYDHAHNDYLEFILEAGVAGTLLFMIFLCFFIRRAAKGRWDGKTGIIRVSMIASVTALIVHSIFDFNLHIPSNALMFALIMGMLAASSDIAHETQQEIL
jgi:O-antigen ligase